MITNSFAAALFAVRVNEVNNKSALLGIGWNMEKADIEKLKNIMLEKRLEAEKAAYAYCCACPVGKDREQPFEIYERIRNATRLYA